MRRQRLNVGRRIDAIQRQSFRRGSIDRNPKSRGQNAIDMPRHAERRDFPPHRENLGQKAGTDDAGVGMDAIQKRKIDASRDELVADSQAVEGAYTGRDARSRDFPDVSSFGDVAIAKVRKYFGNHVRSTGLQKPEGAKMATVLIGTDEIERVLVIELVDFIRVVGKGDLPAHSIAKDALSLNMHRATKLGIERLFKCMDSRLH